MTNERTTEELVSQAREGDRDAFDELVRESSDDLRAFVVSRLGAALRQRVEVDDIVQETFLSAFERFDRFEWRGPDSLLRWLFAIAEHLIRNASRKRVDATGTLSLDVGSTEPSPSRAMRRDERFDRLRASLATLSPDYRRVIELARIEGLTIKEIAERMARSPGAVKQLLSRALDSLKQRFGDTESLSLPERSPKSGGRDHE